MSNKLCPLSTFCHAPATGRPAGPVSGDFIVFVHGIRSCHETFEPLADKLRARGLHSPAIQFAYFDYRYRQSIAESGQQLANVLKTYVGSANSRVTIVGHSMGGLVARLALLQDVGGELGFVKRLIMLGTPNHGTLHTGRMGLLSQLLREITGEIWTLTSSQTGVKELTEIDKLLDIHLNEQTEKRTRHVEYVSIPATCFHEGAGVLETMSSSASRTIGMLPLGFELLKAHPCWRIGFEKPHDGIVEESSVYLGNRGAVTRRSERRATCRGVSGCGPYVHVRHDDFRRESHITIQVADRTAAILAELISSPTLEAWRSLNEGCCDFDFEP